LPQTPDNGPPNVVNYSTVGHLLTITQKGLLSLKDMQVAQSHDPAISKLVQENKTIIVDDLHHVNTKSGRKICLPEILLPILIHTKHYINPGVHNSTNELTRIIQQTYYFPTSKLKEIIARELRDCHICQIYADKPRPEPLSGLPREQATRLSWSIDLITDMPVSRNQYKLILLCVDDFSNFVVSIPIKTATAENLIAGIKNHLIQPFGFPPHPF